jgi:hypothetical protein
MEVTFCCPSRKGTVGDQAHARNLPRIGPPGRSAGPIEASSPSAGVGGSRLGAVRGHRLPRRRSTIDHLLACGPCQAAGIRRGRGHLRPEAFAGRLVAAAWDTYRSRIAVTRSDRGQ